MNEEELSKFRTEFNPAQIPDRLKIRAFFIGNLELARAIKAITQQPVTQADCWKAMSAITKEQVFEYIQENGLPQELLDLDKNNPAGDGEHLRAEGEKYLFFYSERGTRSEPKVFDNWESMIPFVVDHYFDRAAKENMGST